MFKNIQLTPFWVDMTDKERRDYFHVLGIRLLCHRYRYYVLDSPIVSDNEYDYLERHYEMVAKELNEHPWASDMVGYDFTKPHTKEAEEQVLNERH